MGIFPDRIEIQRPFKVVACIAVGIVTAEGTTAAIEFPGWDLRSHLKRIEDQCIHLHK